MASDPNMPVTNLEKVPWYIRIPVAILDKQGIATVIALFALWAGWKAYTNLGERHFMFIDSQIEHSKLQTEQSKLQSRSLDAIDKNTSVNSELLRRLNDNITREHEMRAMEHKAILDTLHLKK